MHEGSSQDRFYKVYYNDYLDIRLSSPLLNYTLDVPIQLSMGQLYNGILFLR